jgi:hypothetical protein
VIAKLARAGVSMKLLLEPEVEAQINNAAIAAFLQFLEHAHAGALEEGEVLDLEAARPNGRPAFTGLSAPDEEARGSGPHVVRGRAGAYRSRISRAYLASPSFTEVP